MNKYYVYIMTNESNRVFYVGVTSNLTKRAYEHRDKVCEGFTAKYNLTKLIYFEETSDVTTAIEREKKLKKWPRGFKIKLIEKLNPDWNDLYNEILA